MIDTTLLPNPLTPASARQITPQKQTRSDQDAFARILGEKLPVEGVKFSQHAKDRLVERGIKLDEKEMKSLSGAVDEVAKKGGRESLIMVGDAALVVSIKNRTVITAMDRNSMGGNVFTNIDSAVVI